MVKARNKITMKPAVRHRRLQAFYQSKVLNALMIVIMVSLLQGGYMESLIIPVSCASTAFILFAGYATWLWIKKPRRIVINKWLSGINGKLSLYFLIVAAIDNGAVWWYIFPLIAAILTLFISMVRPRDEVFEIT